VIAPVGGADHQVLVIADQDDRVVVVEAVGDQLGHLLEQFLGVEDRGQGPPDVADEPQPLRRAQGARPGMRVGVAVAVGGRGHREHYWQTRRVGWYDSLSG
jgi:hypothetical protein